MNKLLVVIVSLVALGVLWWGLNQYGFFTAQTPSEPIHLEEKAEAPNLPKPPSFVERVLKDNPDITREVAEAYEQERIQTNIAHQEYRVQVLKDKNISNPEEMMSIEQDLARELHAQFRTLEEKYNIKLQQGAPGFTGASVSPILPN